MSFGPRIVIALQICWVLYGVWRVLCGHAHGFLALLIPVLLLIGLCLRRRIAWYVARWFVGLIVVVGMLALLADVISKVVAGEWSMWFVISIQIVLAIIVFRLLGRSDSREYFNAPSE